MIAAGNGLADLLADVGEVLVPEVVLATAGCMALLVGRVRASAALAGAGVVFAALSFVASSAAAPRVGFGGTVAVDGLALAGSGLALAAAASAIVLGVRSTQAGPEGFALVAFAVAGAVLAASARDLVPLVAGLGLANIAVSAALLVEADGPAAREAAMKQFLVSSVSVSLLAYGASLVATVTGASRFTDVARVVPAVVDGGGRHLFAAGVAVLVAALLVQAAAAPFHLWLPDVYHGASRPMAVFVAVAPRAAALIALARLAVLGVPGLVEALAVAGVCSTLWGDLSATTGGSALRVVARLSIASGGAALVAAAAGEAEWTVLAVLGFGVSTLGAAVAVDVGRVDDLDALGARSPGRAAAAASFLASMAGTPPAPGFLPRVAGIAVLLRWGGALGGALAVASAVSSVAATFAAARLARRMYAEPETRAETEL